LGFVDSHLFPQQEAERIGTGASTHDKTQPAQVRPGLFVVVEQAEDVVLLEAVAAFEEVEFDGEGEAGDFSAELLDELDGGLHGAAGGEQVVDEDDALAALDGVEVNFEDVGAVFEIVSDAGDGRGKLAGLAHGDKAGVEAIGEGGAEDEAARLNAEDQIDLVFDVVRGEHVNELCEAGLVFEDGGNVVKKYPWLGKIGDGAHERFEGFHIHGFDFFGHCFLALVEILGRARVVRLPR